MDSLYLLIPIALIFCAIAIKLLLWAINNGQYDDLDKEAWRIIADDEAPPSSESHPTNAHSNSVEKQAGKDDA